MPDARRGFAPRVTAMMIYSRHPAMSLADAMVQFGRQSNQDGG
jgi:hypothetical protein